MNLIYGEQLPENFYMGVLCDGTTGSATILERFENRYGYLPSKVIVGEDAVFDAEDWGLEVYSTGKKIQAKHIWLR